MSTTTAPVDRPASAGTTDSPPAPPPLAAATTGPSRLVVLLLAVAVGAAVANLYYAQPLLTAISGSLGVGSGTAALVVTLTQVGYALGLVLLVPLGDLVENRRLTSGILLLTALALVATAVAPSFPVLLAALAVVGLTSVVAQILVPLAAHLAPPEARGRVVGRVTSGLLLGIMLARSVSSFAAAAFGWRSIFLISAVLMVLTSLALRRLLPERRPEHHARYGELLASTVGIVRAEPVLVRRALSQGLVFAAFTAFWTGITSELVEGHGFSHADVALFALVGAAGAAAAPVAGRLADAGHGSRGRLLSIVVAVAAMALAGLGSGSVVLLALAGVLLDLAVQSHQVLSLRDVYALRADARARLNSAYMGTIFAASAIASAATGALHGLGWGAVTVLCLVLCVGAGLLWRPERRER